MKRRLRLIVGWGILAGVMLSGCATINESVTCPASSTGVSFALQGSTVGNTLLSMLGSGLTTAGLLAKEGAAAAPATTATMKYTYVPVFGSDSGSLNCTQPPTTTIVTTSPPASIVH